MHMTATYSPEDNKLRLYASQRLDDETYQRVKAAGFRWAPKQDLFFTAWTPQAENLAIELCGEVEDEDKSLVERAEERSERFDGYGANRAREADQLRSGVAQISKRFEFGQPILVGHHSERKARKDAERMESGMRSAVKAWETSEYWKMRAASALQHAKYLERPEVRARRIKTIEADKRKQERNRAEAERWLKAWTADGLTLERARALANVCHLHLPRKEGDDPTFNGYQSAYGALEEAPSRLFAPRTLDEIVEHARKAYPRTIAWADRWIAHYDHRLTYERAMLMDKGGIVAELVKGDIVPEVGGRVQVRGEWYTVLRVNKKDGRVLSVRTNARFVPVCPLEDIKAYEPPTAEAVEAVTAAMQLGPLCNYPGEGFVQITQAQWDAVPKDYRGYGKHKATAETGVHRVRKASGVWLPLGQSDRNARLWYHSVFITDAKRVDPPKAAAVAAPPVPKPEPVLPVPVTRQAAPEDAARLRLAEEMKEAKAQLKQGRPVVQAVAVPQLFPTPADLAARMVELAQVQPGDLVLEPSAGTGRLVQAVIDQVDTEIVGYEINASLCQHLRQNFPSFRLQVRCADFLEVTEGQGRFDVVLMNPPFAKTADVAHIRHALTFLRPGGRLVAICAGGPRQAKALKPLVESMGGLWEPLPAGTFIDEGTSANTVLLSVTQPAQEAQEAPEGGPPEPVPAAVAAVASQLLQEAQEAQEAQDCPGQVMLF